MNWTDGHSFITIHPPDPFSFDECLMFLGRSDREILHTIEEDCLFKLVKLNGELILFKVGEINESLKVEFLNGIPSEEAREKVAVYIWEWFDLDIDLNMFYRWGVDDPILSALTQKYAGLRMISIHDLFEALVWAVLGQQINLPFAYTLKKRFVEEYGEHLTCNGENHWLFPSFEEIAVLEDAELRELQITGRKAAYIIGVAGAMKHGGLTKDLLMELDEQQARKALLKYKGIGAWTADYVMMKCLHVKTSFPVADVGLQNALKAALGYERKPALKEMEAFSHKWEGWQGYAAFYLWRSLYDKAI
jgi:DNA-3-methyladenine glycosylase II